MYYKSVLNEQTVYILFFCILRDADNWSEYGSHISTTSSVIISAADSWYSTWIRYFFAPMRFILAETIKLNHIEVACTPSIVSANRKFFLAITICRTEFWINLTSIWLYHSSIVFKDIIHVFLTSVFFVIVQWLHLIKRSMKYT